jgi:hypothetical protein
MRMAQMGLVCSRLSGLRVDLTFSVGTTDERDRVLGSTRI